MIYAAISTNSSTTTTSNGSLNENNHENNEKHNENTSTTTIPGVAVLVTGTANLKVFKRVVSKHLTHFCYLIRLVLHQHLNSHVAYPGIPPENSNHTRGQYQHLPSYPLLRLL